MKIATRRTKYLPEFEQRWYCNGKLHREDGPAVIFKDYMGWALNGKRHRLDGPARIWVNMGHFDTYYVDGKQKDPIEYPKAVKAFLAATASDEGGVP